MHDNHSWFVSEHSTRKTLLGWTFLWADQYASGELIVQFRTPFVESIGEFDRCVKSLAHGTYLQSKPPDSIDVLTFCCHWPAPKKWKGGRSSESPSVVSESLAPKIWRALGLWWNTDPKGFQEFNVHLTVHVLLDPDRMPLVNGWILNAVDCLGGEGVAVADVAIVAAWAQKDHSPVVNDSARSASTAGDVSFLQVPPGMPVGRTH